MLYNDYKYLLTFIQVFAVFFGLLGNIISFVIFSRKTFRNNSISTYCRALAIFDSLIFAELAQNIGEIASNFSFSLVIQHDAICKVFFYMMTLYSSIPAWILVAFSIDKMLSMRRNAILILRKKWFQWSVVAFISIFNIILYIEIPIKLVVKKHPLYNNTNYCDVSSLDFFTPFIYAYLFETDIIPFAVMFVTSIITIRLLAKSRNALTRGQKADAQRKIRDMKFAISSLAFNIMFITFKMPLVIAYAQANNNLGVDLYFYSLALFLFFFNASINFYVHFATNSIFRRELFVILRITKDPNATSINSKSGGVLNRIKPTPNITTDTRKIANISQNTRIEI